MAENGEKPVIEMFIDQQVFVDSIRGRETVREFSALTEITTFEQRAEDLHLEGNLLFTAYVDLGGDDSPPEGGNGNAPQGEVRHMQHRMPFDIRMPVRAQDSGMLTVAVRVPEATMDVLGPGWIHVRAVMEIEGLSPSGGYVAHCGAQEAVMGPEPSEGGESLAAASPAPTPAAPLSADEPATSLPRPDAGEPATSLPGADAAAPTPFVAYRAEKGTEAAPGTQGEAADTADAGALSGSGPTPGAKADPTGESEYADWRKRLSDSDRMLNGPAHPFKTGRPLAGKGDPPDLTAPEGAFSGGAFSEETASGDDPAFNRRADPSPARGSGAEEFHFEHAVEESPSEGPSADGSEDGPKKRGARSEWEDPMIPAPMPPFPEDPTAHPAASGSAAFAAGGALGDTAFAAADAKAVGPSGEVLQADASAGVQTVYGATPEAQAELSAAEWFWKTMNIPAGDTRYTMKFRIVQSMETVEEIASLYNVSVGELIRVNQVAIEEVTEGSLLYIPHSTLP